LKQDAFFLERASDRTFERKSPVQWAEGTCSDSVLQAFSKINKDNMSNILVIPAIIKLYPTKSRALLICKDRKKGFAGEIPLVMEDSDSIARF